MPVPVPIDELSTSLGEINATLRAVKERMSEVAADQQRREDGVLRDLRTVALDQRAIEKTIVALDQKITNIEVKLTTAYDPVAARVTRLESDLADLNRARWKATGIMLVVSLFAGAFATWVINFLLGAIHGK